MPIRHLRVGIVFCSRITQFYSSFYCRISKSDLQLHKQLSRKALIQNNTKQVTNCKAPVCYVCYFKYVHLHYAHCIRASSRLFKTPSAAGKVAHEVAGPVTAGRVEVAHVRAAAIAGLTRPIVPADRPIEFCCSV